MSDTNKVDSSDPSQVSEELSGPEFKIIGDLKAAYKALVEKFKFPETSDIDSDKLQIAREVWGITEDIRQIETVLNSRKQQLKDFGFSDEEVKELLALYTQHQAAVINRNV